MDALPSGLADIVRPITRAEFHGKQDSLAVFQVIWEPEDTIFGRIGESIFRKPEGNGNATFTGIRTIQHPELQYDQTITLDKNFVETADQ